MMTKKEQKKFATDTIETVKEKGFTIGHFLKTVELSRSHWHFIRKGERPLTEENKEKIEKFFK